MTNIREVPFFDYKQAFISDRESLIRVFEDVGHRGAFVMQEDLVNFEAALASYTGANHAVGVANATDGLEMAWMAVGLKGGDEVIICSHTMLATASAIKTAGGVPVPVDIADDGLIDPDAIANAIGPNTVGIMPTQLNGRTCNMDSVMSLADKHHLYVVEDAAQALGSKFKGKCAGTFGQASAISFFPAKVLGCLGDGGAVLTNSSKIFEAVYQLHDHGRNSSGEVKSWGRNSRLDNLQSAILNERFKKYENVISRRRKIAEIYGERLQGIEELTLPPGPNDCLDHFDIYQNYELEAERRDDLKQHLRVNGIGTLIQWGGKAVHQWEVYEFKLHLPKVELFFEKCLMLPMNMFISDDDVHYVCDKVYQFYRG